MAIKGSSNAVPQRRGSSLSAHALHCPEVNSLNLSLGFMRLVLELALVTDIVEPQVTVVAVMTITLWWGDGVMSQSGFQLLMVASSPQSSQVTAWL